MNQEKTDLLRDIFNHQLNLQVRLGADPRTMPQPTRQRFINLMATALMVEAGEAVQCTPWKNPEFVEHGWKRTAVYNPQHFEEELVDCLHFLVNLCLAANVGPDKLHELYVRKNAENHARQERGY